MLKNMLILVLSPVVFLMSEKASAQSKIFTEAELLGGKLPAGFTTPLPQIVGWDGDEKLLLNKRETAGGAEKTWVMDMKTGAMTEAPDRRPCPSGTLACHQ